MRIEQGLLEGMVAQRTSDDVSDAVFGGVCAHAGTVRATVSSGGQVLSGCDALVVGSAAGGRLTGRLAGIPVGGPYRVELWIDGSKERLVIREFYVGDVWILGGQSNMQGCAQRKAALPAHPQVHAFYMDDRWAPAQDPMHNLWDAVDEAHAIICGGNRPVEMPGRGVGPGVAFGQAMYEMTGVPQGLIACAHGGTSMSQWNPKLKQQGGKSLYGATMRRFEKNGGKAAGVVWYQGCSDANPDNVPLYTKRMKALVQAFRRDCADADLPFVAVQIACLYNPLADRASWNAVQVQQERLQDVIPRCAVVSAIDLTFDDAIHLDGPGQHRLGRRLARAMQALRTHDPLEQRGMRVKKVTTKPNLRLGSMDIAVEFDHVVGHLQAAGKPSGFSLESNGGATPIYKTEIAGNTVILHTGLMAWEIDHKELWYGYGVMPYCNITDAADRPLPVFGPVLIGKLRALTPFVQHLRLSPALPLSGAVEDLPLLSGLSPSALQPRTFTEKYCNIFAEWHGSLEPQVIWFACRFRCDEAMQLSLSLGYDGPVAAWIDGQRIFADPKGINPANPDEKLIPFAAAAGEHEALVALSSNCNRAWGIFLRFERRDVPKKLLAQGNGAYLMPKVVEAGVEDEAKLVTV